jgi:hypothetical protein
LIGPNQLLVYADVHLLGEKENIEALLDANKGGWCSRGHQVCVHVLSPECRTIMKIDIESFKNIVAKLTYLGMKVTNPN